MVKPTDDNAMTQSRQLQTQRPWTRGQEGDSENDMCGAAADRTIGTQISEVDLVTVVRVRQIDRRSLAALSGFCYTAAKTVNGLDL